MEAGQCRNDGQVVDLSGGGLKYDLAPPLNRVSALPLPDTTSLPFLVTLQRLHELGHTYNRISSPLLDQCTLLECCNPAGRFRISRSADKLVQLVHQAARDAAASHSPALAQSLIAAVTQVAELAASLPPQAHAKQMQVNVPACALRMPHGSAKICRCHTSAPRIPLARIMRGLHCAAKMSEHDQCTPRFICLT